MPAIAQVGFNDLLRDPAAPFIGAENADVTIIGFVDYNCPYCKKMQPEIDGLLKADPKVRVLYKDWPIFGDVSETAARTALVVVSQGDLQDRRQDHQSHQTRRHDNEKMALEHATQSPRQQAVPLSGSWPLRK